MEEITTAGYVCDKCGMYVYPGIPHYCSTDVITTYWGVKTDSERIADALERIANALEKMLK
jgi:hypothetical protein